MDWNSFAIGFFLAVAMCGSIMVWQISGSIRKLKALGKAFEESGLKMVDKVPEDHPDPEGRPGAQKRIVRTTVTHARSSNIMKLESGWSRNRMPLTMAESGVLNVICGIRDMTRAGYTVDEIDVSMMETLQMMAQRGEKKARG